MTLQPGQYGVTHGHTFLGIGIEVVTRSWASHAFLYVGDGLIVESEADGAVLSDVHKYDGDVVWCPPRFTDGRGDLIATAGRALVGTPYSYLGAAAIGVAKITGRHTPAWARRRLDDEGDLFCSQLVDEAYQRAGVHLFDDGRWNGAVAPSDLLALIRGSESWHGRYDDDDPPDAYEEQR